MKGKLCPVRNIQERFWKEVALHEDKLKQNGCENPTDSP